MAFVNVEEASATGIGCVGTMNSATRKPPKEEGIYGAEEDVPLFCF